MDADPAEQPDYGQWVPGRLHADVDWQDQRSDFINPRRSGRAPWTGFGSIGGGDTNMRHFWVEPPSSLFRNGLPVVKAPPAWAFERDDKPKKAQKRAEHSGFYSDPRVTDPSPLDQVQQAPNRRQR